MIKKLMIDREKLIKKIEEEYDTWGEEYDVQQILGDIEDMPAVVVELPEDAEGDDMYGYSVYSEDDIYD